jgi:hypothetical protein
MWILIVLQLVAGSATAKNSMPIVYSGVVMQEFATKNSCEHAKITIALMNLNKNDGEHLMKIHNGILKLECVKK